MRNGQRRQIRVSDRTTADNGTTPAPANTSARPVGKLLLLTIPWVTIARMPIDVAANATSRLNRLDRLAAANTAALVLDAAPLGYVPNSLARQILTSIGAGAVAINSDNSGGARQRRSAGRDRPRCRPAQHVGMVGDRRIHRGHAGKWQPGDPRSRAGARTGQFIEVVIDELPLRRRCTASPQRPDRRPADRRLDGGPRLSRTSSSVRAADARLTADLSVFHENPESSARIIVPSQRGDSGWRNANCPTCSATWCRCCIRRPAARSGCGLQDQPRSAQPAGLLAAVVRPACERTRSARAGARRGN